MELGLSRAACIVTGASSGIGRTTARALCAEGANVLLTALETDHLVEAVEEAAAAGGQATGITLDITSEAAAARLLGACRERFGAVDVLVNCAGSNWYRHLSELSDDDLYRQWELNVMALARLLRVVAPEMASHGGGRVVAVGSVSAKQPSAANLAYSVTKAAQVMLVRGFAEEYAPEGVIINSVLPGPVDTPLWRAANEQIAAARGVSAEQIEAEVEQALPRRQVASTLELAQVIVFLASPLAANVVGSAMTVDGGSARQLF